MDRRTVLLIGSLTLGLLSPTVFADSRTIERERLKSARTRGLASVSPTYSPQTFRIPNRVRGDASSAVDDKSAALLDLAKKQDDEAAFATLQQLLSLQTPSTVQSERIRSQAHERIARFYAATPAKRVLHLALAIQYAVEPERRSELEREVLSLGGDPFAVTFDAIRPQIYSTQDSGSDDSCGGAFAVSVPHVETMNISPAGDHNWRSFDIAGPEGAFLRIETISDQPGRFTDDTDLGLWDGCPESGGVQIFFNDDQAHDFTSRIDTPCLVPGTYYVEVGGFFDSATPDNFTLEIEATARCVFPVVDGFEPDDEPDQAASIGLPTSTPANANGWGRARKEIQGRSIFPAGDKDHATFDLTRNERVRIGTAGRFPTFFNGFDGSLAEENPDTVMKLRYESLPFLAGRCNQPDDGFLPVCFSDDDCPNPLNNPIPGLPTCIDHCFSNFNLDCFRPHTLVRSDDRSASDAGSEMSICLPSSASNSPSLTMQVWGGGYLVEATAFSSDTFNYELQVKNEVACRFEFEPNNAFETATPIEIGTRVAGFYDFFVTYPFADADLYRFDVEEPTTLRIETFAPDANQSDTAIELFFGPDDQGDYFYFADDDDGGAGFLSSLQITLPPASEFLGNTVADADYFVNVTSFYYNPNFYYELEISELVPATSEAEPNDSIATANTLLDGQQISARMGHACDVDTYRFELDQPAFVELSLPAGGDAALQLVSCASAQTLSCDDDSAGNLLPRVDGCLPPGSYCARVRAFASAATFDYALEFKTTAGCVPTDPPTLSGDRAFSCLDFDACD